MGMGRWGRQKGLDRHPGPDGQTHTRKNLYILATRAVIRNNPITAVPQQWQQHTTLAMYDHDLFHNMQP